MAMFQNIWRKLYPPRVWAAALAAMVAIVAVDTATHLRTTWNLTAQDADQPPVTDASSPSGYAANQHELVLPYIGMDGYHWVMQTQQMLATGELRVRHVDYDNAPDGREVHWSSLFRWWLAALAEVDHFYTDTPLPLAVENVIPFANTLLIVLLLIALMPVMARRFGGGPAALLAFGAVGVFPFYESFIEGRTDHHGLASLNALLTLLLLLGGGAGWVKSEKSESPSPLTQWLPDRAQARRWFIASGIVGGCGLWISMISEVPVLAGVGLGALLATGLLARNPPSGEIAKADPTLWRVWGFAGAATSLFFYFVEYFPSHFGMRLEVNHPLYALAWAGGGELLCRLSRWWSGEKLAAKTGDWLALGLSAAAVLTVPAIWWLFADQYFWVFNHFLWVFHVDYIMEFINMGTFLKSQSFWIKIIMTNPVILLAIPMVAWSCWAKISRPAKALLLLGLLPGVLTFIFSAWQIRWAEINYALWLAALVGVAKAVTLGGNFFATQWFKIMAAIFLAGVLLPNPMYLAYSWVQDGWVAPVSQVEGIELVARDIAQRIRARIGDEPAVIISGPTSTTWLIYWGGFQGLGTFYWENLPGMKANAEIYGTTDPQHAFALLQQHHAKYLVILPWVDSPTEYARLWHNLRKDDPAPDDAFVWHMQRFSVIPQFLRPVYYELPPMGQTKGSPLMIYEFAPNQTAPEALTRLADWQQENGNLPAAAGLLTTALKTDPENLPALIAAARVDLANGAQAQFAQIVQRLKVVAVLDDQLELEDRVRLAAIFNAVNDNSDFQRELTAALRQLNAKNLRSLRPESLYALLMLSAKTGQLEQRPGLLPYINTLLELNWRVKFLQDYSDMEKAAGHPREAVALLRRVLGTAPRSLMTLDRLARLLATSPDSSVRNGKEAIELATQAREIDQGQHVNITDTLACALAEDGEFAEAITLEASAIKIAENAKATTVANILRTHLGLFNSHLPYREESPKTSAEPN
jgi:tetratricopeptide (TPR) repeat protein